MFGMEFGFLHFYWGYAIMILIGIFFIYLGAARDFEPLLLVPIGLGMILVNLPLGGLMDYQLELKAPITGVVQQISVPGTAINEGDLVFTVADPSHPENDPIKVTAQVTGLKGAWISDVAQINGRDLSVGDTVLVGDSLATIRLNRPPPLAEQMVPVGLISRFFNYGLVWEIIPCLIFLGLGALTDFGPIIANPKSLLLGAAAQFGVYFVFFSALLLGKFFPDVFHFGLKEAASIGIIGGADGPTTIYLTQKLAPWLLGTNAVAAYSYMAMVPLIQPPIIRLLCSKKEIATYMKPQIRNVSKLEKIIFPVVGAIIIILFVPQVAPLIGMFMFGNLLREVGGTQRLAKTAQESFIDIVTIILGITVGAFMAAESFLRPEVLAVFFLGLIAFATATASGVMMGKLMAKLSKEPFNPIIGAAGVSAVPMSARVVQRMGQKANPRNFLLMHAMGPNVAGVIGTAIAAGFFLGMLR
jgi:sodium ion-translocating decarboxylase beta subunit